MKQENGSKQSLKKKKINFTIISQDEINQEIQKRRKVNETIIEEISDEIDSILNILNNIDLKKFSDEEKNIEKRLFLIPEKMEKIDKQADYNDEYIKKKLHSLNIKYTKLQNEYISKKFMCTNIKLDDTANDFTNKINVMTGNMLFSVASIFLGISLTSAMVAGIDKIASEFLILYFLTGGLITLSTISIAALLLRNFDRKSFVIILVLVLYFIIWIVVGVFSYNEYNDNKVNNTEQIKIDK